MATAKRKDTAKVTCCEGGAGDKRVTGAACIDDEYSGENPRVRSEPSSPNNRESSEANPEKIRRASTGSSSNARKDLELIHDAYGVPMIRRVARKRRMRGATHSMRVRGPLGDSFYRQASCSFGPTKGPLGDLHGRDFELMRV
eukprot:CAMPEP_0167777864 /NCGR_PEP_ID=MMETSP0111_2-20121227/3940_1 /TAXON_ID=91324 /ORGANISM="Lotharella globosa, Strain CCCM811" /LENGTH=142 /DNA_ID=CAMNT_0007668115 /DNA_START=48 /DNA_END=476 /DNA_ORIENTATION=-